MTDLKHPETGAHVRASRATADALIEEHGYIETTRDAAEAPAATVETPAADDNTGTGSTPPPTETSELPKKLGELIKYAEEQQLFDAEQLDAWRKPGTKTADVRAAIEQKITEGSGQ